MLRVLSKIGQSINHNLRKFDLVAERRFAWRGGDWSLGRAIAWKASLVYFSPSVIETAPATRGGPASRNSGSSANSSPHRGPGIRDRTHGLPIESTETRKGLAYEPGRAHNW